ncbi:MAG TPA: hypothetical protein PK771_12770, partial [Spirochaetota bacterium]|nr:hypothetical protein [Spirochaetota bacterium]
MKSIFLKFVIFLLLIFSISNCKTIPNKNEKTIIYQNKNHDNKKNNEKTDKVLQHKEKIDFEFIDFHCEVESL